MNSSPALSREEFRVVPMDLSWRQLLRVSAYGELGLLLLTTLALRDVLAAGLSVLVLIGLALWLWHARRHSVVTRLAVGGTLEMLGLRWRGEKIAVILLGLLFADMGFYTLTGAASNLLNGSDWFALALPAGLATFAGTGLASVIAILVGRANNYLPDDLARNVAVGAALALILVLTLGAFTSHPAAAAARAAELRVTTQNIAYSTTTLVAPGRRVTIALDNRDLFWHTFTIDALKVDLKVPMRALQRVEFDAPPGSYTFYCSIPGHSLLGMQGTLVVK